MRNIWLAYILNALNYLWFWVGIWVLFYLRFTNYAGIGIIESVMIGIGILLEVPTGAIGDLLGKKKTLAASFIFSAIGSFLAAIAHDFNSLLLGIVFFVVGGALESGTMEAFLYDSLKEKGLEKKFDHVVANVSTIKLLAISFASIAGGFLYVIDPRLPMLMCSLAFVVGFFLSMFLTEPSVDTLKFSLKEFLRQNTKGLSQLFKNIEVGYMTVSLLISYIFFVIVSESLSDIQAVEYGFSDTQLGMLWAAIFLVGAGVSKFSSRMKWLRNPQTVTVVSTIVFAVTLLISPYIGLFVGGAMLMLRSSTQVVFENAQSVILNNRIESKYRATTLSTFTMISNVPYVFTAYLLGSIMDRSSAKGFAFWLGVALVGALIILNFLKPRGRSGVLAGAK